MELSELKPGDIIRVRGRVSGGFVSGRTYTDRMNHTNIVCGPDDRLISPGGHYRFIVRTGEGNQEKTVLFLGRSTRYSGAIDFGGTDEWGNYESAGLCPHNSIPVFMVCPYDPAGRYRKPYPVIADQIVGWGDR